MIGITKLYIFFLHQFGSFKVTVAWEIDNFGIPFPADLEIDLDEMECVATTCWFVEAHVCCCCFCCLFCFGSNIEGRKLCWCDFIKYALNIIMCPDTCEPICFKLGMMLNTTKRYSLIPVWMASIFTQDHSVMRKLELVQSWCSKVAWSNDGSSCKEDDCEKVL